MQVNVNPGIKMDKMQLNVLEEKNAKKSRDVVSEWY